MCKELVATTQQVGAWWRGMCSLWQALDCNRFIDVTYWFDKCLMITARQRHDAWIVESRMRLKIITSLDEEYTFRTICPRHEFVYSTSEMRISSYTWKVIFETWTYLPKFPTSLRWWRSWSSIDRSMPNNEKNGRKGLVKCAAIPEWPNVSTRCITLLKLASLATKDDLLIVYELVGCMEIPERHWNYPVCECLSYMSDIAIGLGFILTRIINVLNSFSKILSCIVCGMVRSGRLCASSGTSTNGNYLRSSHCV